MLRGRGNRTGLVLWIVGSLTCAPAVAADKVSAGQVVFNIVGRNQVTAVTSPTSGSTIAFGYLSYMYGLGSVFKDTNVTNESTAYFTIATETAPFTTFTNGNTLVRLRPGYDFLVRYNPDAGGNFDKPETFLAGQVVARFHLSESLATRVDNTALEVSSGVLVSSEDFTFNGKLHNLKNIVPYGFTATLIGSAVSITAASGVQFTVSGSALALGKPKRVQ